MDFTMGNAAEKVQEDQTQVQIMHNPLDLEAAKKQFAHVHTELEKMAK